MARGEIKAASVAWATFDELTPALRERAVRDRQVALAADRQAEVEPRHRAEASRGQRVAPSPTAVPPPQPGKKEHAAPEILIPGYVDPNGRDSLGHGLDGSSIAAVVATDRTVRHEREALSYYLLGTFRDPHAAKAQLDEMVKRQGWTSTAARIAQNPTQLGELLGRTGLFASARAKTERAMAEGTAGAIAPGLKRIAAAEARTALTYRDSVAAQRKADAIPIPKLSERAEAAVATLAAAADDKARAALWRSVMADPALGPELQHFSDAVQRRFGERPCAPCCAARAGWQKRLPCRASTEPRSPESAGPSIPSSKGNAPTSARTCVNVWLIVRSSGCGGVFRDRSNTDYRPSCRHRLHGGLRSPNRQPPGVSMGHEAATS